MALDAGHNILNQSNQSPDGSYKEWEHNLDVCQKAAPYLTNCGVRSILVDSLNASQGAELYDLVKQINATKADICVSWHSDASTNAAARGFTFYSYKMAGQSLALAKKLEANFKLLPFSGLVNRGIKDGQDLYVIAQTTMPCALVEAGFHTNSADLVLLKAQEFREAEARAVAKGIVEYFGLEWKELDIPTYKVEVKNLSQYQAATIKKNVEAMGFLADIIAE